LTFGKLHITVDFALAAVNRVKSSRRCLLDHKLIEQINRNLIFPGWVLLSFVVKVDNLQITRRFTRNNTNRVSLITKPHRKLVDRRQPLLIFLPRPYTWPLLLFYRR
jgi:hypothetical protein